MSAKIITQNGRYVTDDVFKYPAKVSKTQPSFTSKLFCDPVHKQIAVHPVCVAIIDTPEFQRLRHIKQTGLLEYVYPGATHNRFNHSLGVCFLAGKFVQELREHQPELPITNVDILCIELAGLCHDLGHGPFSHTWEKFVNTVSTNKKVGKVWKHENVSANMLDYLIEVNNLYPLLISYGIGPREISLIKDYITGTKSEDPKRAFLHQIVNNDDSGLDVDKWDYFLRDCHYLGLPCSFEYERLIQCAKVLPVNGKYQICFRDKVLECVYNVFRTRSKLHRMAYQHKVLIIMEKMFIDAVILADNKCLGPSEEILQFWNWSMGAAQSEGEELHKALKNYCLLTDLNVFSALKYSTQSKVAQASNIIKAIERRSFQNSGFYKHVGLKMLSHFISEKEIHHEMCLMLQKANETILKSYLHTIKENVNFEQFHPVTPEDFCVCVISINWGQKNRNPVDSVYFYSKNCDLTQSSENYYEVAALLPKSFEEIQAHIISCRNDVFAIKVITLCFQSFFNNIVLNGNGALHN